MFIKCQQPFRTRAWYRAGGRKNYSDLDVLFNQASKVLRGIVNSSSCQGVIGCNKDQDTPSSHFVR